MTFSDVEKTLEELAAENPKYLLLLNELNVNFDFERDFTLGEICFMHSLDYREVLRRLEIRSREAALVDEDLLLTYDVPELVGYILFTHHGYMERELPRLEALLAEAVRENKADFPELLELQEAFSQFKQSFQFHMAEEERHFFPFYFMLATDIQAPALDGKSLERLAHVLACEDAEVLLYLDRLRIKTRGYHIPPGAGPRYRAVIGDLKLLEAELRRHARVERQILFPKVVSLQVRRLTGKKFEAAAG
jgi:regulator of cell morphogenesis and NO signaling